MKSFSKMSKFTNLKLCYSGQRESYSRTWYSWKKLVAETLKTSMWDAWNCFRITEQKENNQLSRIDSRNEESWHVDGLQTYYLQKLFESSSIRMKVSQIRGILTDKETAKYKMMNKAVCRVINFESLWLWGERKIAWSQ